MSQASELAPNSAQIDYWNGIASQTWARFQEQLDRQVGPLGSEAMRVLAPAPGEHVLDIGCGCGRTSLDLAARVGTQGSVFGADLSKVMLEVALARPRPAAAAPVIFRELDAQTGDLGKGVFDAAFSRFGVMFFSDPVAAFSNIRRALKPGGRLAFVCWRPVRENPWMTVPLEAAARFLPPQTPPDPTAPGPFAFADADRLRSILTAAGFGSIAIDPFDALIGGSDLDDSLQLALRIGPLGAALREVPERAGDVAAAVRQALLRYATPEGVLMPAGVWIVQARNG